LEVKVCPLLANVRLEPRTIRSGLLMRKRPAARRARPAAVATLPEPPLPARPAHRGLPVHLRTGRFDILLVVRISYH
jgi:hypothetical protein